jgi:Tol biopolymer transport system component
MNDLHPSWSPDGRSLAFLRTSPDGADVMTIPVPGGMERKAFSLRSPRPWGEDQLGARDDTGPTWSPDGRSLLVSDSAPSGHGLAIFSISNDGSSSKQLSYPEGEDRDLSPTPSPDGEWVAFVRFTSYDSADLYLVPSDGGKAKRLTLEHTDIQGLAWMPGSRQLLFSSNRTGIYALWTLDIAGGPPSPVATGGEAALQPTVSRDGNTIVYADASFSSSVIAASLRKPRSFYETVTLSSPNSESNSAQFSPDGKKIVFASNRTGSWELWTASADGDNQTQLTNFNSSLVGSPRWSPDGTSIAFSARSDVHAAISVISARGGKPRMLSSKESEEKRPGWSPDGRWIFFTSDRGGKMRLWKTKIAGGDPVLVSEDPRFDVQPSRSEKIYFTLETRGLWQMNAEGGPITAVTGLEKKRFGRLWTVAKKGIYFIDEDSDRRALQLYDFGSGHISSVGNLPVDPLIGYPSLSVSPVDDTVLFSGKENVRSNLMIFRRDKTTQTR